MEALSHVMIASSINILLLAVGYSTQGRAPLSESATIPLGIQATFPGLDTNRLNSSQYTPGTCQGGATLEERQVVILIQ